MSNVPRDENHVPTILGALNTDGVTPTPVQADPTAHTIKISDGTTGSDLGPTNDVRDENRVTGLMAVSEVDGTTPVVLYVNSSGELLVDST